MVLSAPVNIDKYYKCPEGTICPITGDAIPPRHGVKIGREWYDVVAAGRMLTAPRNNLMHLGPDQVRAATHRDPVTRAPIRDADARAIVQKMNRRLFAAVELNSLRRRGLLTNIPRSDPFIQKYMENHDRIRTRHGVGTVYGYLRALLRGNRTDEQRNAYYKNANALDRQHGINRYKSEIRGRDGRRAGTVVGPRMMKVHLDGDLRAPGLSRFARETRHHERDPKGRRIVYLPYDSAEAKVQRNYLRTKGYTQDMIHGLTY